jgi:DnaJ-class molecular chaperone
MEQKKDLKLALTIIAILLIIGIACFLDVFPAGDENKESSKEPLRIMYKVTAGKVLFDHKAHADTHGYSIECGDCHHHEEENTQSCITCHPGGDKAKKIPKRCFECHDNSEIEDITIKNHADTLHEQCIECHKASDMGPVECSQCHVI